MIQDCKVLFLDEPTRRLDEKNSKDFWKIIKKISKKRLVVAVSHDSKIVDEFADRVIDIRDGEITKDRYIDKNLKKKDEKLFALAVKKEEMGMRSLAAVCVFMAASAFAGIDIAPIDTSADRNPSDDFTTRPNVFEWEVAPLKEPVWVDLFTGAVYEIPAKQQVVHSCGVSLVRIPVYDSPCVVAERCALEFE